MAEVIKETRAGPITERVAYTRIERGDSAVARAEKGKCSTLARKKTNHRVMQRSLGLLMATNFKLEDFFLTLTFDNDHLGGLGVYRLGKETREADIQRHKGV